MSRRAVILLGLVGGAAVLAAAVLLSRGGTSAVPPGNGVARSGDAPEAPVLRGAADRAASAAGPAGRCELHGLVRRGLRPAVADVALRVFETEGQWWDAPARVRAPAWQGTSDADGRFAATGLARGVWAVSAVAPDGALAETQTVVVADAMHAEVTLALADAPHVLRGKVVDAGAGVAGATVTFGSRTATTAADGTFAMEGLRPARGTVVALLTDGRSARERVVVPHADPVELRIRPFSGKGRFRVLAVPGGAPVAGALLHVGEASVTTDADGRAVMAFTSDEGLWVAAPGFVATYLYVARAPESEVEVRLRRAATLRGKVRDAETRRPLAGVLVETSQGDRRTEYPSGSATSGADGAFLVEELTPGPTTVVARGGGRVVRGLEDLPPDDQPDTLAFNPLRIDLVVGETKDVDLELVPAARVRGRVVDGTGAPAVGIPVVVSSPRYSPRDDGAPGPTYWGHDATATDADGRYELPSLIPERDYVLSAGVDPVHVGRRLRTGARGTTTDVDLTLPRGVSFDVRVVDEQSGEGIPGVVVGVEREEETGAEGIARVGPYTAERVEISAWTSPDGEADATVTVDLSGGAPAEPVVLRIAPLPAPAQAAPAPVDKSAAELEREEFAAELRRKEEAFRASQVRIAVRVLDAGGMPVPRAFVHWSGGGESNEAARADVRAGDGELRIVPSLLADGWRLEVREPRDADDEPLPLAPALAGPFDAATRSVEVRLVPERTIEGRVVGPDGKGVKGLLLRAVRKDWKERPKRRTPEDWYEAATDGSGAFRLRGLAEGPHVVAFHVPPRFRPVLPAPVDAGTKGLELRLRRPDSARLRIVDAAGRAIAGATVTAIWASRHRGDLPYGMWNGPSASGISGSDGVVDLHGLSDELAVDVSVAPPHGRTDVQGTLLGGWMPRSQDVVLARLGSVRGVVRLVGGGVVPGALVQVLEDRTWERRATTGEDGAFELSLPVEKDSELRAEYEDSGAWIRSEVATVRGGAAPVELLIDRGLDLTVRVEGFDAHAGWGPGRSHDGVLVRESASGDGERVQPADLDTPGSFTFRQLSPNQAYVFWLSPDVKGAYVLARGLRATVGTSVVTARLEQGLPTSGRVLHADGLKHLNVFARQGPIGVYVSQAADGTFAFPGLPDGIWQITAGFVRGERWERRAVEARAGARDVEIDVGPEQR